MAKAILDVGTISTKLPGAMLIKTPPTIELKENN
jgi:hypothetical protein